MSIAITESTNDESDDDDHNGAYAPKFDWPAIANSYYPSKNMALLLALPVIGTVSDPRPKDLQNLPWEAQKC